MSSSANLFSAYDIEAKKRGVQTASFVKFNMRAVSLQSQELKKLQVDQALTKGMSGLDTKLSQENKGNTQKNTKSMSQMHTNFRQILKQTAKEQHDMRKQ